MGYTLNIVGEQHYQGAISASQEGDPVLVAHEVGNPHDSRALVVKNRGTGQTLGYLPRDSFVHRIVFDEGGSVEAEIETIFDRDGTLELKIYVELQHGQPTETVRFVERKLVARPVKTSAVPHSFNTAVIPETSANDQPNSVISFTTVMVAILGLVVLSGMLF